MFGFNTFNRCESTETMVSQSAHTKSKYWTNLASINNNGTAIEQDPMHTASFYKESSK
jgi:hypothetical protein